MEYRKRDSFITNGEISHEKIERSNIDLVGHMKREMASTLTEMAIHKYTDNVLLKLQFHEEDIYPDKIVYNGHSILATSHKRIRASLEVFDNAWLWLLETR